MLIDEKKFPYFTNVIKDFFVTNYDKIIESLNKYKHLDGQTMKTFIWNHQVTINYTELIKKFEHLYTKFKDWEIKNEKSSVLTFSKKKNLLKII